MVLILLGDADEDCTGGWQHLAGGDLCLGEGFAEVVRHTHDLAGRFHLGPKYGIDARELAPWEDWRLYVIAAARAEVFSPADVVGQELAQLASGHQARDE